MPHVIPPTTPSPDFRANTGARPTAHRSAVALALAPRLCALCLVAAALPGLATEPTTDPTGRYRAADGRDVQVFRIDGALFAVVGRGSALRLVPDGDGQHVSADGRLRLRLVSGAAATGSRAPRTGPMAAAPALHR
jgi:hypothetical protein